MTNSEPGRLDRVERLMESIATQVANNREDIVRTDQATRRNASAIRSLGERMEQFIQQGQADRERMEQFIQQAQADRELMVQLQQEVRGIQTENRHILEILLNQQND